MSARALCLGVALLLAGQASAAVKPNLDHGLALQGFDAVSYVDEQKAQPGKPEIQAEHQGAQYRFVSEAHRQAFLKQPARYLPAYGGWCAYAMAQGEEVQVDPTRFLIQDGKLLLFYNGFWGDTLKKWQKEPKGLLAQADAWWKKLNP